MDLIVKNIRRFVFLPGKIPAPIGTRAKANLRAGCRIDEERVARFN